MWIALNLVLLFIASALTYIPVVGGLLFALFTPVFAGGLTLGCRDVEAGKPLLPAHLFAGFQRNAAALVSIGGVYVVGQIAIFGLLTIVGGPELQAMIQAAFADQRQRSRRRPWATVSSLRFSLAGALFVPLAMAVWFAPVLAVLNEIARVPGDQAQSAGQRAQPSRDADLCAGDGCSAGGTALRRAHRAGVRPEKSRSGARTDRDAGHDVLDFADADLGVRRLPRYLYRRSSLQAARPV